MYDDIITREDAKLGLIEAHQKFLAQPHLLHAYNYILAARAHADAVAYEWRNQRPVAKPPEPVETRSKFFGFAGLPLNFLAKPATAQPVAAVEPRISHRAWMNDDCGIRHQGYQFAIHVSMHHSDHTLHTPEHQKSLQQAIAQIFNSFGHHIGKPVLDKTYDGYSVGFLAPTVEAGHDTVHLTLINRNQGYRLIAALLNRGTTENDQTIVAKFKNQIELKHAAEQAPPSPPVLVYQKTSSAITGKVQQGARGAIAYGTNFLNVLKR